MMEETSRNKTRMTWVLVFICLAAVLVALILIILLLLRKPASPDSGQPAAMTEVFDPAPAENPAVEEELDLAGEAIAGYGDEERVTIYEYTYSGRLFNEEETHDIILKYTEFPVDDDGDGWFDVSGDYRYPAWQKDRSFSFEGRTDGKRLILFTENSEMFDLMSYDRGFVLKGEWYKYKSNDARDRDRGSWTKHLQVELKVSKN